MVSGFIGNEVPRKGLRVRVSFRTKEEYPGYIYILPGGAMDSVSDFESGGCGFESRRSCFAFTGV